MLCLPKHIITPLAGGLIAMMALLGACDKRPAPGHVLEKNAEFTVSTDSVVQGEWLAWAGDDGKWHCNVTAASLDSVHATTDSMRFTQGTRWQPTGAHVAFPRYDSPQPLLNALFFMSTDAVAAHHSAAGITVTTDTIGALHAVDLSLALVEPHRCMDLLRACVDSAGTVRSTSGHWPIFTHRSLWVQAAWEVYLSTGDKNWLKWAHGVATKTLLQDQELIHQSTGLLQGANASSHGHWLYPAWMLPIDQYATMSLANNIYFARAMDIVNEMGNELGLTRDDVPGSAVNRHVDAINQLLWDENRGYYSAMLYGTVYKVQAPVADNLAQALAVMWNIASDDRAATLIEKTPIVHQGVGDYYPTPKNQEPCFMTTHWPITQAYWNLASAAVSNEFALRSGWAALIRAQAFFASSHIRPMSAPDNDLEMGAASLAMTLRAMAGIRLTTDGIEFAPSVPSCFGGRKTLSGLPYRDAVLNISIDGTGNEVASMTVDGKAVEGSFLPATITGEHEVVITLTQGHTATNHITLARANTCLPTIPQAVWTPDSGFIENFDAAKAYKMLINGVKSYSVSDSAFRLPPTGDFAEISLISANKFGYSHCTPPRLLIKGERHTVDVNDPQVCTIDSMNRVLHLRVNVKRGGAYLLDVTYKTTGLCDLRGVMVNSHPVGWLVLPAMHMPSAFQTSNVIEVELLRGDNSIDITAARELPASGESRLGIVRIYKNNQKYRL